jgi:dihydroorotate dehydrogenase
MLYRALVRPLLFTLPAETAQGMAETLLGIAPIWQALSPLLHSDSPRLRTELCGISLASPIGLAAGFDKDFRVLAALSALGFGYLTGGTVTLGPRPGNPKPRMARDVGREALLNALGFPGKGAEPAVQRMRRYVAQTPLVASIAGTEIDDVVACHRLVEPHSRAVEVNISSPNTAGLRAFHDPAALTELLVSVKEGASKPIFVKLPPYADTPDARSEGLALARACADAGVDGLTVANSRPVQDARLAVGKGGLGGRPLLGDTLRMVSEIRAELGTGIAINACGGIFTGAEALAALKAGATTVQVYTALVYRGPATIGRIKRELLAALDAEGVQSIAEVHATKTG